MNQKRRESPRQRKVRIAKERRKRKIFVFTGLIILAILLSGFVLIIGNIIVSHIQKSAIDYSIYWSKAEDDMTIEMPDIDIQLLTINDYSRPGTATERIQNIVVHYTANPGTSAQNNRDYFEGLKDSQETKASSNFIIGLEGEIIQCVPTNEVAYASNHANIYSVSIELCHPDETGAFNDATYASLVELCAYLCDKFDLESEDIIRHYDVTGKLCPLYFVEHEDEWEAFKVDVENYSR